MYVCVASINPSKDAVRFLSPLQIIIIFIFHFNNHIVEITSERAPTLFVVGHKQLKSLKHHCHGIKWIHCRGIVAGAKGSGNSDAALWSYTWYVTRIASLIRHVVLPTSPTLMVVSDFGYHAAFLSSSLRRIPLNNEKHIHIYTHVSIHLQVYTLITTTHRHMQRQCYEHKYKFPFPSYSIRSFMLN